MTPTVMINDALADSCTTPNDMGGEMFNMQCTPSAPFPAGKGGGIHTYPLFPHLAAPAPVVILYTGFKFRIWRK